MSELDPLTNPAVKTNYILIDYENVQPTDLALLRDGPFKVRVFLGPNQAKIPVSLAAALQALGRDAEYVALEAAGANALDFHIAYYLGALSTQEPSAMFHVISKDTGFDPLIRHLQRNGVSVQRSVSIAATTRVKPAVSNDCEAQVAAAIAHFVRMKAARPRTQKTVLGTLHALFRKELSEERLSTLFAELCSRGILTFEEAKVSYTLPTENRGV